MLMTIQEERVFIALVFFLLLVFVACCFYLLGIATIADAHTAAMTSSN